MDYLDTSLSSLVRYGVSEELIAQLQAIEETQSSFGEYMGRPLYEQSAIYEMRCSIFCHNYGKTLWELSHYVAVLEHLNPRGVVDLLWGQELVTGARLRSWLMAFNHLEWLDVAETGPITVKLNKRDFTLNPRRINLLAAWTSFITLVDPGFISKLSEFRSQLTETSIDQFAKYLKEQLDRYLEPHLQAIHQQRQGRHLLTWLKENSPEGSILSDDAVLSFWSEHADSEEGDFKRFVTVADCSYRLSKALTVGESQRNVESAASYYQDETGEDAHWQLDLASSYAHEQLHEENSWLDSEVSDLSDGDSIFSTLMQHDGYDYCERLAAEPLAPIKFMTAKDHEFCSKIETVGMALEQLPLTFLRSQIFGQQQARITEDLRKTKGQNIPKLVECEDVTAFPEWLSLMGSLIEKLELSTNAINYILLSYGRAEALASVVEELSDNDRVALQSQLTATDNIGSVVSFLRDRAPKSLKELEKSFNKVNREGFKEMPSEEQIEDYLDGRECLHGLIDYLQSSYRTIQGEIALQEQTQSIETSDRQFFKEQFQKIYTGQEVLS